MRSLLLLCLVFCLALADTRLCRADEYEQLRKYDLYFLEAMVQRQKGNDDAAFDLLSRCLELNPLAGESYYFIAQYYAQLKQNDKALACFRQAAELSPDNATYMETLANAYLSREQYTDAIAVTEKLYASNKDRVDLLEMLYRLYGLSDQFPQAIEVLNRLEAIDGKSEKLSQAKSRLYLALNDKAAALKEIESLSAQYPNDPNYQRLYADMLMEDERADEAYDIYRRILAEEPENSLAQLSLRSYYLTKNDSTAADSLTRHILLNRHTPLSEKIYLLRREVSSNEAAGGDSTRILQLFHAMLAVPQETADIPQLCAAYMDLKQMPRDSVSAMLELALEIEPDKAPARLQLVSDAWDNGDNDRVIELCKAGRQYSPDEMAFYYYQGMAYYRKNDTDRALDAFRNGIGVINEQSNPAIVSDFYAVMGDLLHAKGLRKEAFEAYDSCLQWKEDNIGCLNNYAYFLSEEGENLSQAEQMSLKTVKAEPKNATYLDTYAWILFMQKRYAEARIYIDQALQNDTQEDNSVIVEHGGDIYALCNDPEKAVELWQKALRIDPQNKVLQKKIKRKKYIKKK